MRRRRRRISGDQFTNKYYLLGDGVGDHVELDNQVSLSVNSSSIAIWFRIDTYGKKNWFLGSSTSETYEHYIGMDNSDVLRGESIDGEYWVIPSGSYSDNDWHLIAVTAAAGTVKTYVDNALVGTRSCSNNLVFDWLIGANFLARRLYGGIDELAVWSNPLGVSDIAKLWGNGTVTGRGYPGNVQRQYLTNYWNFENKSGTTIYDVIGGNNGTLTDNADIVSH